MTWIPIDDKERPAPRDGTHFLAYGYVMDWTERYGDRRDQVREIWCAWNDTYRYEHIEGTMYRQVPARSNERWRPFDGTFTPTHWLPIDALPPPPEEGEAI